MEPEGSLLHSQIPTIYMTTYIYIIIHIIIYEFVDVIHVIYYTVSVFTFIIYENKTPNEKMESPNNLGARGGAVC